MKRRRRPRGGKHGAEPTARVRLRELQVLTQVLEGRTQHHIAAALHISQPAVSRISQRLEERLLADVAWRVERQRARQTLRLEFVYAQAMQAWRASLEESLRKRQRKTDGPGGASASVAEVTSEHRYGDPRFLEIALKALADLRTLWGVDAPDRLAIDATTPFTSMTDAALEAEIARQARLLAHPEPTAGPATDSVKAPIKKEGDPDEPV